MGIVEDLEQQQPYELQRLAVEDNDIPLEIAPRNHGIPLSSLDNSKPMNASLPLDQPKKARRPRTAGSARRAARRENLPDARSRQVQERLDHEAAMERLKIKPASM